MSYDAFRHFHTYFNNIEMDLINVLFLDKRYFEVLYILNMMILCYFFIQILIDGF